jgi:putative hydrolase of the HAD superfamily
MIVAMAKLRAAGYRLGCITNNMRAEDGKLGEGAAMSRFAEAMGFFEHVIESAASGVRKPDPRIYRMMCDALALPPEACIYLDDLGINCKPAAVMGMHAIKVTSAGQALTDLGAVLGMELG